MVRDSNGNVITTLSQKLRFPFFVVATKAMTAIRVVRFSLELGLTKAEFKGDLVIITEALNKDNYSRASFGILTEDAKNLARNLYSYSFLHVKHIGNVVAHALARRVQHCIVPNVLLESVTFVTPRFFPLMKFTYLSLKKLYIYLNEGPSRGIGRHAK